MFQPTGQASVYADHILNDDELIDLTGYTRAGDQIKWLKRNGVHFTLRKDGKPRTTCSEYARSLSVSGEGKTNWDAIRDKPPEH